MKDMTKGILLGIILTGLLALATGCSSAPAKRNHGSNYKSNPYSGGDVFLRY